MDLSIPSEDIIGGYTFTSPPHQLQHEGTATLAIQNSDHPPTSWMSNKVHCKVQGLLLIILCIILLYSKIVGKVIAVILCVALYNSVKLETDCQSQLVEASSMIPHVMHQLTCC